MKPLHAFVDPPRWSSARFGWRTQYACICGVSGTLADVEKHLAEKSAHDDGDTAVMWGSSPSPAGDDFGGNTEGHYLPNEPREPAPVRADLIQIIPEIPQSIAEMFQNMLRQAFTAGLAAAQSSETFETWYQREVLQ